MPISNHNPTDFCGNQETIPVHQHADQFLNTHHRLPPIPKSKNMRSETIPRRRWCSTPQMRPRDRSRRWNSPGTIVPRVRSKYWGRFLPALRDKHPPRTRGLGRIEKKTKVACGFMAMDKATM